MRRPSGAERDAAREHVLGRQAEQMLLVPRDCAAGGLDEPGYRAQSTALSCAVRADERDYLTSGDFERNAAQRAYAAVVDGQVLYLQHPAASFPR